MKYPILEIDLNKLSQNAQAIIERCKQKNIQVTGVVKGCNACVSVTKELVKQGCHSIGSSRIDQLIELTRKGIHAPKMLLRLPMVSEISDVVTYADISLNSEKAILNELNKASIEQQMVHGVILMYDLGDLREGLWDEAEFLNLALYVENKLNGLKLLGIGTNLGCYGSVLPTVKNLEHLSQLACQVEEIIGRPLTFISGGATTSLPLVFNKTMPKKINHLRIGEGILLSRDLKEYFGCDVDYLQTDTFVLKAEIIEIQNKPSYPVGELFIDAFGNAPQYIDKGMQKRALLAVGKQDFGDHTKLISTDKRVQIIGSSSDHLIVDITQTTDTYEIGDTIAFTLYYQSMLYLNLSTDVQKVLLK